MGASLLALRPTPMVEHISSPIRPQRASPDALVAELASAQHGVVAIAQLRALGLTAKQVRVRVERGRWHALHRGVYAVGHRAVCKRGRLLGAVLACGPGAVLSHRSAADLWAIRQHRGRAVEVTAPVRRRHRDGIRVHRSATLAGDVTVVDGIPVTTVARTLTDLADVVVPTALRQALATAERLGLVDRADLTVASGRRRVVRGAHVFTRSQAESLLNAAFPTWAIEPPEINQDIGPWEVDFLWRRQKIVLELDFYATHKGRFAYLRDREKTADLQERGFTVLRVDGENLDVRALRRRLTRALAEGGAR